MKQNTQIIKFDASISKDIGKYSIYKIGIENHIKKEFSEEYANKILSNLEEIIALPKEIGIVNDDGTGDLILIASRRDPMYVPGEDKLKVCDLVEDDFFETKYKFIFLVDTAEENIYIRIYKMDPEEAVHYIEENVFKLEQGKIEYHCRTLMFSICEHPIISNLTIKKCIKILKRRDDIKSDPKLLERLKICKMKLNETVIY